MTELERLFEALDGAIWEMSEGMTDMPDDDLWTRPHPKLLSVGELVAHAAYGEISSFLGPDFESPLNTPSIRYYLSNVDEPVSLALSAKEVWAEMVRIHEAAKSQTLATNPSPDDPSPFREGWTWRYVMQYMAFHAAYHTGQIYSVRHLLGHATVDN